MVFSCAGAVLLAVKAGAPTMNTITFPPGSTSHRSYCCLQGLERTSKAAVWFCIPVRALQPLEPPTPMKTPAPLVPTAIFNDFPKTHSGFSGTVHHSGRVKWNTWILLCASLHDAHVPPVGKGSMVWIRRQRARAWDNGNVCINDSVAGCSAQNIIYSSHWREITAAILSRSRKISWPGNT